MNVSTCMRQMLEKGLGPNQNSLSMLLLHRTDLGKAYPIDLKTQKCETRSLLMTSCASNNVWGEGGRNGYLF